MKNKISVILFASILIFAGFFIHCGKPDEHPHSPAESAGHEHTHDEAEPDSEPGGHSHDPTEDSHASTVGHRYLQVSPQIIKQWGIQYTEVQQQDYVEKVTLTGVVKVNQETTFFINSLVPGIVTAIKKDIGDTVRKGDVLCVLNSPGLLQLKTNYIKAFQEYRLTKENYDRARKLFNIKAIEQKELTSRESAYKTAMAEYFSLEAELSMICSDKQTLQAIKGAFQLDKAEKLKAFLSPYYNILSPGSGKVMMRNLSLGERIETTNAIFEISATQKMWVILDALEKDLPYIEKNKTVQIETDVYPGKYFNGRVLTLMEKIDPELRTLKVRVEVNNQTDCCLKPEMYVRGYIEKKLKRQHLAVPVKALVKLSGVDGVFVIEEGEFLFKPVQVIETDSAGFAFVNGLQPGELVISAGAFYLKAEYEIQSGKADSGHGHEH
ncbi:MAG: efflux RND transporter periplasmic adaptor subunit [Candidatus Aminicenantes bacterium]|nr:MAG: efflux RND transporter periplasmic adaptor subunit [Candidatus Aminicenantes bacterium]